MRHKYTAHAIFLFLIFVSLRSARGEELGLNVGAGMLSGTGTGQGVRYDIAVGLNSEYRGTYFGIESDSYYGTGSVLAAQGGSGVPASVYNTFEQYGALINVKGQLPFSAAGIRWIPKVGLGYGTMCLNLESDVQTSNTLTAGTIGESANGLFGVVGLEVEPLDGLRLKIDYAFSLVAGGEMTFGGQLSSLGNASVDGASFARLRMGGDVRLSGHLSAGVLFTERLIMLDTPLFPSGSSALMPAQIQLSAVLSYRF